MDALPVYLAEWFSDIYQINESLKYEAENCLNLQYFMSLLSQPELIARLDIVLVQWFCWNPKAVIPQTILVSNQYRTIQRRTRENESVLDSDFSGKVRKKHTQTVESFTESSVLYWKKFWWLDISCNFSTVKPLLKGSLWTAKENDNNMFIQA